VPNVALGVADLMAHPASRPASSQHRTICFDATILLAALVNADAPLSQR